MKRKTRDGLEILREVVLQGDREAIARAEARADELSRQFEEALAVGQALQSLRKEAGLSQRDLAERVGTTQSVISQLEDAEYEGHSLTMLRRIASALGRRVVVSFEVLPQEAPPCDGPSDAEAPPARVA